MSYFECPIKKQSNGNAFPYTLSSGSCNRAPKADEWLNVELNPDEVGSDLTAIVRYDKPLDMLISPVGHWLSGFRVRSYDVV